MQSNNTKHSKIRNTGLLFEFLIRQITANILDKKDTAKLTSILKRRFNENTNLGKELALYNIVMTKKFKDDKKADYFIEQVISHRRSINETSLKREKYNLIKEIKEYYEISKLFSSKVKNYKVYASIYKLFEYSSLSPDEKTESFFNLVEHVTTDDDSIKLSETVGGTKIPQDEDLRILTYQTLLEKFNQKYNKLNSPQKNLLREYINNVSNTNSLKDYLVDIVKGLKEDLKNHKKKLSDKVVKIKMDEAIASMDKFCGVDSKSKNVKDSHVTQTMRYLELLKELKKSGNKNKKTL
jgi:hypothetical protein